MTDPKDQPIPTPPAAPTPAAPTTPPTSAPAPSALVASLQEQIDDFTSRGQLAHLAVARNHQMETERFTIEIDEQSRTVVGLKAQADEADKQNKLYADDRPKLVARTDETRQEIAKLEAAGDTKGAAELREDLRVIQGTITAWDHEAALSQPAAVKLRAEANEAEAALATTKSQYEELAKRSRAGETAADVLDDKAAILNDALTHAKEMERLDLEAHRLRDEGKVAEADQVKAASDEHARLGVEKINEAGALEVDDAALDAIPGAGAGSADPNLIDDPVVDGTPAAPAVPPVDPAAVVPEDGTPATPVTPVPGADPDEIEMPPEDMRRPDPGAPATDPATPATPAPRVIDMEPEVIEVPTPATPAPRVIDMEPEVIEVPTPATPAPTTPTAPPDLPSATPPATPPSPTPPSTTPSATMPSEGEQLAEHATLMRASLTKHYASEIERIGLARDDAARKAWSSEQEAKAADQQVAHQRKEIADIQSDITRSRTALAKAETDGDPLETVELQEDIAVYQTKLTAANSRLDHAAEAGTKLRVEAAKDKATVAELEAEKLALRDRSTRAEVTLDAMENKAMLQSEMELHVDRSLEYEAKAEALEAEGKPTEAAAARKEASEYAQLAKERSAEAEQIQYSEKTLDFVPKPAAATPDPLATPPTGVVTPAAPATVPTAAAAATALFEEAINPAAAVTPAMAVDPAGQSDPADLAAAVVPTPDPDSQADAATVADPLGQDEAVAAVEASTTGDPVLDPTAATIDLTTDPTTDTEAGEPVPAADATFDPSADPSTGPTGDGLGVEPAAEADGYLQVEMEDLSVSSFASDASNSADQSYTAPAEDDSGSYSDGME